MLDDGSSRTSEEPRAALLPGDNNPDLERRGTSGNTIAVNSMDMAASRELAIARAIVHLQEREPRLARGPSSTLSGQQAEAARRLMAAAVSFVSYSDQVGVGEGQNDLAGVE
jgi:hypothetical protein